MAAPPPIELWFGLLAPVLFGIVTVVIWVTDSKRKFTREAILYGTGLIVLYAGLTWWMCTPTCLGF